MFEKFKKDKLVGGIEENVNLQNRVETLYVFPNITKSVASQKIKDLKYK